MRQIEVESLERPGVKGVCWIDHINEEHTGYHLRFKNETEWWKIRKVYELELDKGEIKRNWHVGGL